MSAVRYKINGKEASEEEFAALPGRLEEILQTQECPGGHQPACWPMASLAMQVHPRQIPAVLERNRKAGLNVEYQPDGKPVLTDRGKRRDLMRLERLHDHHGGYGD